MSAAPGDTLESFHCSLIGVAMSMKEQAIERWENEGGEIPKNNGTPHCHEVQGSRPDLHSGRFAEVQFLAKAMEFNTIGRTVV